MKKKSLKINFIMNAILTMTSFVFPLITFPYVSRILLPVGTGKVSFAISVVTYFSMFAQLGIPTYGIRTCAQVRDKKEKLTRTVQEIMIINLCMCVVVYAAFFIALATVPRLQGDRTLFLVVSTFIFFNAIGTEWLYKALEQYTYITVRSIVFKVIAVAMMFLLIKEQSDYVFYGAISIFASSASNILNFINLRKYVSLKPIGDYQFSRHFKMIGIFFAMSVATTVYTNLDTVMLGFMKTDIDVGYYNAAVKIKNILVSIVTSLGTVLLPRASFYVEKGLKDEFSRITKKALNFVCLLALPLAFYFMVFARYGVLLMSGSAYKGSIVPMQIIMPTLFFIGVTNIIGIQMMVPLGKEKQVLYSEIAGAVVDLLLNAVLIPMYAAAGAAIGTLVAEFVVLIWQYVVMRQEVLDAFIQVKWIRIMTALIVSVAGSWWVKRLSLSNFLTLVISAVCFFAIYLVLLTIMREPLVCEIENQLLARLKRH